MTNRKSQLLMAAIAALAAFGAPAYAGDIDGGVSMRTPGAMRLGAPALAPGGFLDFCRRNPTQCETSSSGTSNPADVSRQAASLYWASVFQTPARAVPASTRPISGPNHGRYDWSRTFPAANAASHARLAVASAPPAIRPRASTVYAPVPYASTQAPLTAPIAAPRLVSPVRTLPAPFAQAAEEIAPAVRFNPMTRTFAKYAVTEVSTHPIVNGRIWSKPQPFSVPQQTFASPQLVLPPVAPATPPPSENVAMPDRQQAPNEVQGPTSIALDRDTWAQLNTVNRSVNRQIRRSSDEATYGELDYWQAPTATGARGDCEDYVLAKRAALVRSGVPATALSIAIVRTRWGESHAVLLVSSTTGEYVLDNLSPWISRWDQVDYVWQERQAPGRVFEWVDIAA